VSINVGDADPVALPPFKCSPKQREAIYKAVDELMEAGIIEYSNSPWAARSLLVEKRGQNEPRVVIDSREMNKVVKDKRPLPRAEDILRL